MAVQLPKSTRATSKEVDRRLEAVVAEQERIFLDRQPRSRQLSERAVHALAGGVTSSWQITRPQTVWISHGREREFDAAPSQVVRDLVQMRSLLEQFT